MKDEKWLVEKVEKVPYCNWMYYIICLLLFRPKKKFTYQELYVFFMALNFGEITELEEDKKSKTMCKIVSIYYYNNNKLPFDLNA